MNNNFTQLSLGTSVIASLGRSNSFLKIDKLLEKFEISKENKKTILITYSVIKKNIDCALFSTSNINHLKLVNKGFEKYKDNFAELFSNLDGLFE